MSIKKAGLRLLAISDQGELTLLGHYPSPTLIQKVIVVDGYAYLAIGEQGLDVVDVSDPAAPRLVSRYDTPGEARDWPYPLVADGDGGLRVLDIHDPLHLVEVASHLSCDGATQVVSANGVIYVMQPLGGLWLLRLTPP